MRWAVAIRLCPAGAAGAGAKFYPEWFSLQFDFAKPPFSFRAFALDRAAPKRLFRGRMTAPTDANLPLWVFPIMFATGLGAGFVDSIAGGGGLITLPVLFNLGIPPEFAFGTNKLQATFGSGSAAYHYTCHKLVDLRACVQGVIYTAIAAAAGSYSIIILDKHAPGIVKQIIPWMLLAVTAFVVFKPKLGEADVHPRMKPAVFYAGAGIALGFYDGFLGPGTGTFWTMGLMLGLGFNLTKATGYTKVMNVASNAASLAVFVAGGHIYYGVGLCMGIGQLLGARIGSRMVVARGTKFIRPIFLTMVLALTIKLLLDVYFKK